MCVELDTLWTRPINNHFNTFLNVLILHNHESWVTEYGGGLDNFPVATLAACEPMSSIPSF